MRFSIRFASTNWASQTSLTPNPATISRVNTSKMMKAPIRLISEGANSNSWNFRGLEIASWSLSIFHPKSAWAHRWLYANTAGRTRRFCGPAAVAPLPHCRFSPWWTSGRIWTNSYYYDLSSRSTSMCLRNISLIYIHYFSYRLDYLFFIILQTNHREIEIMTDYH